MFVILLYGFSFLLIKVSAVSDNTTCPAPIDRTQVRAFQCILRTQTGKYGGSKNDIYVNLYDTYGRQTDWYKLDNTTYDVFQPNTLGSFTLTFTSIVPAIASVEIKEYYDPNWFLVYLQVYCPDEKIDMMYYQNGVIRNRDQMLPGPTQPLCPERGTISNGTVTCSDDTKWGSVCHYKCNSEFLQVKGPDCVYCHHNATWSAPVNSTTCDEISCPPGNLTNGNVSCTNDLFFNSTCTYQCDDGYVLNGSASATCLLTGNWSDDLPSCDAVMCPHQQLANGTVQCTNGASFDSVCTYTCNRGFGLVGSNTTTCQDNGNWNNKPPICTEISCPLRSLTNGKVSCTYGLFFDSTCTYACDEGFALNGSTSATCLLTGDWSDDLPRCQRVMCPHQQITNGTVQCTNGDTFDSVCTYTCNRGFVLVGSNTTICQDNGNWNPKPPICTVVQPDNHKTPDKGLSVGAIAGIAVAVVVVIVVVIVVGGVWLFTRLKRGNRKGEGAMILGSDKTGWEDIN